MRDQSFFPLVIILSSLWTLSIDNVLILLGENWCCSVPPPPNPPQIWNFWGGDINDNFSEGVNTKSKREVFLKGIMSISDGWNYQE